MNDVTVINELAKAYKTNPDEVALWLSNEHQELTRGSVRLLREYLEERARGIPIMTRSVWDDDSGTDIPLDDVDDAGSVHSSNAKGFDRLRKSILLVEHAGRPARLILHRRPLAVGKGWLKYEDDGQEVECNLAEVKLVAILEGEILDNEFTAATP